MLLGDAQCSGIVLDHHDIAKNVQNHQFIRTLVHLFVMLVLIIAIFDKGFSVNFEDKVKTPFEKALKKYDDQPAEDNQSAQNYKSVWNEVQAEVIRNRDGGIALNNCLNFQLKCCGIDSFKDWQITTNADFPPTFNKPEGCCVWGRDNEILTDPEIDVR